MLTWPPLTSRPKSSSSASALRIVSWMSRAIGRAPICGSKPLRARNAFSAGVNSGSTFFSCSWFSSSSRNLSTTFRMTSWSSCANEIVASSRLRNSGVNSRLISAISSPLPVDVVKPIDPFASSAAPAFVVMMIVTLRKSAFRPLLSVSVPWSITCSRML